MSVIVYQFQTVKFIQMMSLTFGLFTQVSGSGPLGPLVIILLLLYYYRHAKGIAAFIIKCDNKRFKLFFPCFISDHFFMV